jgi:hypothetical protein
MQTEENVLGPLFANLQCILLIASPTHALMRQSHQHYLALFQRTLSPNSRYSHGPSSPPKERY